MLITTDNQIFKIFFYKAAFILQHIPEILAHSNSLTILFVRILISLDRLSANVSFFPISKIMSASFPFLFLIIGLENFICFPNFSIV